MTGHLPRTWRSLPALATVLDADRLTELFGEDLGGPLRTSHLRYKPGVSVVARVDVGTTGAVHWVAALAPSRNGPDKLDKVLARAEQEQRHGRAAPVLVAQVPGRPGERLAAGPIGTDPALRRPLAALGQERAARLGLPGDPGRLLRYNPRRRAVLTDVAEGGPRLVTKVTAGPSPADPLLLGRLAAGGLPVLAPVTAPGSPASPHVLHYPWFGDGDLAALAAAARPDGPGPALTGGHLLEVAAAAGAALAGLHVRGPLLVGAAQVGAVLAPARKLRCLAADLAALDPGAAERCARVGRAVAEALADRSGAPARLLHGDFSADQVLVRRSHGPEVSGLRLADLDRMRTGAAADDLGAFLAVELLEAGTVPAGSDAPPLTGALLRGYGSAADLPPLSEILAWAAFHVLARSMEPFRSALPDWRERTGRRLALAQQLVEQAVRVPAPAPSAPAPAPGSGSVPPVGRRPAHPVGDRSAHLVGDRSAHPVGDQSAPTAGSRSAPTAGSRPVHVPEAVPDADGSTLRVRRAWPAADARLVLELEDERGRIRAAEATPGTEEPWAVRVLPHGEDPRLPGLAAAAAAGGRVVVHRHRRRAVVETPDRFVKLLARGRAAQVAELSERLHGLGTAAGFAVPAVLARGGDRVEFSVLPGRSLHALGAAGQAGAYRAAWAQWTELWPALAAPAAGRPGHTVRLPEHTAEDEARTLARWAAHLDAFPGLLDAPPGTVAEAAGRIGDELASRPAGRRARGVLHRDLHDKQLLFDGERLGLLDFDTAALGEPELDLANLAVHLELRSAQGLLDTALQAAGQEAVTAVAGLLGADQERLAVYTDAARLRLACVYAFRPRWRGVAQGLLDGLLDRPPS